MATHKKWRRGKHTILCRGRVEREEREERDGWTQEGGVFAARHSKTDEPSLDWARRGAYWIITHLPTGLGVGKTRTLRDARAVADALADIDGIEAADLAHQLYELEHIAFVPGGVATDTAKRAKALFDAFKETGVLLVWAR